MFFLPINTDAPVYHGPWATLSLIVANAVVFAAVTLGLVPANVSDALMLVYGDGLHPLQWFTSLFVHQGLMHLLGNMFFLWGLGIVVEGKIGWKRFLAVYLTLGVIESALEQVFFLGARGHSLGASSAVFGVMAMALVWAPKNELSIFYGALLFVFFRFGVFEITILSFSLLVIGKEILMAWLLDFHGAVALVHLLGAALGFALGIAMLRSGSVDCEGWDLFSVFRGEQGQAPSDPYRYVDPAYQGEAVVAGSRRRASRQTPETKAAAEDPRPAGAPQADDRFDRLRELLQLRKFHAARQLLGQLQHRQPEFQLPQRELGALARGMLDTSQWSVAVPLLEEYIDRFPERSDPLRLKAAELMLLKQHRPRAALRMIDSVDRERLSAAGQQRCVALEGRAHEVIDSGVIELSGKAWE